MAYVIGYCLPFVAIFGFIFCIVSHWQREAEMREFVRKRDEEVARRRKNM